MRTLRGRVSLAISYSGPHLGLPRRDRRPSALHRLADRDLGQPAVPGVGSHEFGMRALNGQLVADDAELAVVAMIQELNASGLSRRRIAAQLKRAGHRGQARRHLGLT
jgi:hypothetical protein